ncbi:MAG: transcriptional regulator [Proteobacteria bacterium]|nr:MAG: transcriptional regulator [Pseudomonadota bacterium]
MPDSKEGCRAILYRRQQNILKTLGQNIKLARQRRGLTPQLFCERTGINRFLLRQVENGDGEVCIAHYLLILDALNLANDLGKVAIEAEMNPSPASLLQSQGN